MIDGKSFFDLPIKNEEEAYEKIIDMSNNNDYTGGNDNTKVAFKNCAPFEKLRNQKKQLLIFHKILSQ